MTTIKLLVMGTSGIVNDGITSWMRQTFGVLDLFGLDLVTMTIGAEVLPLLIRGV